MMPQDEKLRRAFRSLLEQGPQQAPPAVELALLAAFRQQNSRRRQLRWATGAILAIAAAILIVMLLRPAPQVPRPELRLARIKVPEIAHAPLPAPRPEQRRLVARHRPRIAQPPAGIATRFYQLPNTATLSPFEYGTLVRVQLPRSALRVVGLPVNEDRFSERISADVLLGQDGLARAVRFVQ